MLAVIATAAVISGAFAAVLHASPPSLDSGHYPPPLLWKVATVASSTLASHELTFNPVVMSASLVPSAPTETPGLGHSLAFSFLSPTVASGGASSQMAAPSSWTSAAASVSKTLEISSTTPAYGYNASSSVPRSSIPVLPITTGASLPQSSPHISVASVPESSSSPATVTVYATRTVSASPPTVETIHVSTLTLTSSIISTYAFCETSVSTTLSLDMTYAVTHTRTVYRPSPTTLTSARGATSTKITLGAASSALTEPSSRPPSSSESTTTLDITLTVTRRPTRTSTISTSGSTNLTASSPTTTFIIHTYRSTVTVRSTSTLSTGSAFNSSVLSKTNAKISTSSSDVLKVSAVSQVPSTPTVQIYSEFSGSSVATVTSSQPLYRNSINRTAALRIMGTTSSTLLTGSSSVLSDIYGPTSSSSPSALSNTVSQAIVWPPFDTHGSIGDESRISSTTTSDIQVNFTHVASQSSIRVRSESASVGASPGTAATVSSPTGSVLTEPISTAAASRAVPSASRAVPSASSLRTSSSMRQSVGFIDESSLLGISTHTDAPSLATSLPSTPTDVGLDFPKPSVSAKPEESTPKPSVASNPELKKATMTPAASTALASSTLPTSTSCGESGDFTLTWDDEPQFIPSSNLTAAHFPPVFNPYHHLFFASGYSYVYDSAEPFPALSEPTLALWLQDASDVDTGSPDAGTQVLSPGEIGAGPRSFSNAYWFNATEGYFGCLNTSHGTCQLMITGYVWDEHNEIEMPGPTMVVAVPTCPHYKDCELFHVAFDDADFSGLSGIQFSMIEAWPSPDGNIKQNFVIDNLALGWYNNTCEAGLLRISQRK